MGWKLLTTPPTKSGRYIVGHRGHSAIIHYLAPAKNKWCLGAKIGWQSDPREFGATHYMKLPEISSEKSREADADLKLRNLTRVVDGVRPKYRTTPAATKWQLFLALIGKIDLKPYPAVRVTPKREATGDSDPRYIVTIEA